MADPTTPETDAFAVSAVADYVFGANGARSEFAIGNPLTEIVYLAFGKPAVAGEGYMIPAGKTAIESIRPGNVDRDLWKTLAVSAVTAGAGGNLPTSESDQA